MKQCTFYTLHTLTITTPISVLITVVIYTLHVKERDASQLSATNEQNDYLADEDDHQHGLSRARLRAQTGQPGLPIDKML